MVNALVGGKVAITSDKPQTTRTAVRGVLTSARSQIVFIDTPGYHKPRTLLGKRLNEIVRAAWTDVDRALFVVDAHAGVGPGDRKVASDLAAAHVPALCVVNKIDVARKIAVVEALAKAAELGEFEEFVPVSARSGEGVELVARLVAERLPEGPLYYPAGTRTDQPPPSFVAEIIREKLLKRTREELPHSIAVVSEDYEERTDGVVEIRATIFVERESQKGIVVGKGGRTLRDAGTEAREEVELLFGRKVYLDLRVKVEKDWQRHVHALRRLGFAP